MLIAVRDKMISLTWCVADGIMIPKVQNPRESNLADYRQIALGNVEGKLFRSLIAQRFYQHLVTKNNLTQRLKKVQFRKWLVAGNTHQWSGQP